MLVPRKIYTSCGPIGSGGTERKADPSSAQDDSGYSGSGWQLVVVRDEELEETLYRLKGEVGLVITDSQVFEKVGKIVPEKYSTHLLFHSFCPV